VARVSSGYTLRCFSTTSCHAYLVSFMYAPLISSSLIYTTTTTTATTIITTTVTTTTTKVSSYGVCLARCV
jgi:hypothetical protein